MTIVNFGRLLGFIKIRTGLETLRRTNKRIGSLPSVMNKLPSGPVLMARYQVTQFQRQQVACSRESTPCSQKGSARPQAPSASGSSNTSHILTGPQGLKLPTCSNLSESEVIGSPEIRPGLPPSSSRLGNLSTLPRPLRNKQLQVCRYTIYFLSFPLGCLFLKESFLSFRWDR